MATIHSGRPLLLAAALAVACTGTWAADNSTVKPQVSQPISAEANAQLQELLKKDPIWQALEAGDAGIKQLPDGNLMQSALLDPSRLTPAQRELLRELMLRLYLQTMKESNTAENMVYDLTRQNEAQMLIKQVMKMTPKEYAEYRRAKEEQSRAENAPLRPIKFIQDEQSYDPKKSDPIRVKCGYQIGGTNLVFADVTGQPWPIVDIKGLNADVIKAERLEGADGNVVVFTAAKSFATAVASVYMRGLQLPITVVIESVTDELTARRSVRIIGEGPNAKPEKLVAAAVRDTPDFVDDFLAGRIPAGARRLKVTGANAEGWKFGDLYVIRTPYALLDDARWVSNSVSGLSAYAIAPKTTITLNVDGEYVIADLYDDDTANILSELRPVTN